MIHSGAGRERNRGANTQAQGTPRTTCEHTKQAHQRRLETSLEITAGAPMAGAPLALRQQRQELLLAEVPLTLGQQRQESLLAKDKGILTVQSMLYCRSVLYSSFRWSPPKPRIAETHAVGSLCVSAELFIECSREREAEQIRRLASSGRFLKKERTSAKTLPYTLVTQLSYADAATKPLPACMHRTVSWLTAAMMLFSTRAAVRKHTERQLKRK